MRMDCSETCFFTMSKGALPFLKPGMLTLAASFLNALSWAFVQRSPSMVTLSSPFDFSTIVHVLFM